jgi:hypothetical protein
MGETRVDLLHLLEDLRDAYPGSTEETIITEIVANALDSGAATITVMSVVGGGLTIVDDGEGMRRRDLRRYHDIAASTKTRGAGIGFAGVGIKIALLVCAEVMTETRRGKHHVASTWGLASRHKAPWKWIAPPGLVTGNGTAVRLQPTNPLSPLLDAGFIEVALRRNFQPLFDPALAAVLREHYPRGVRFVLNGRALDPLGSGARETAPIAIRMARRRKPAGAGYLYRDTAPLPEEQRGIGVSTFGKVIKRGWDWLGITPVAPDLVGGIVEISALAECLTLNKADFIRAGARGATYLTYRKAMQEAIAHHLAPWGQSGEPEERTRRRAARPVERDLATVLADLADDFPLLASLVEQRSGGQQRLRVARAGLQGGEDPPSLVAVHAPAVETPPQDVPPGGEGAPGMTSDPSGGSSSDGEADRSREAATPASPPPAATGPRAVARTGRGPGRYGLGIQFEQRPDDPEIGRLIESTVWVNEAHPAYRRAVASRAEGYHVALAVAMALAPLAVEPAKEHAFITAFLVSWGMATERRKGPRRR